MTKVPLTEDSRRALNEAECRFQDAIAPGALVEKSLLLGDYRLCLRFASAAVAAAIMPALAHLPVATFAAPDLILSVWEGSSIVPQAWWQGRTNQTDSYRLELKDGCLASEATKSGEQWLVAADAGRGYVCYGKPDAIHRWKQVSPLRGAINAYFQSVGAHIVHAAAVGDDHQAVLLAGAGGSGKSTTALHCLADPRLYYLGDDLCLVDIHAPVPTVHCLYNTAKARPKEAARFAALGFQPDTQWFHTDKWLTYLYPQHGDRLACSRSLRAILLPRIGGDRLRITRTSSSAAFRAFARWTLATVPCDWRISLDLIAQLATRLPAYWLDLGPDRSRISQAIVEFLAAERREAAA